MLRVATVVNVLALVACAETGDEGMYVRNNTAVTGDTCVLTGNTAQPFLAHGEIQVNASRGYLLTPLIQSKLATPTGVDPIQSTIQLRSANVSLTYKAVSIRRPDGSFLNLQPNTSLGMFTQLFSGALSPGGAVNVQFEIIPVSTIADAIAQSGANLMVAPYDVLHAEVLAAVTIVGDLHGDEVTSDEFLFPVTVCNDCVYNDVGLCPLMPDARKGNPCNPAQDGVVDCCHDAEGNVQCPPL